MAQTRAYITPIDTTGAPVAGEGPHGVYTLTANMTYYFVVGPTAGSHQSVHLKTLTAAMIITSATIQSCDHSDKDVTNFSATGGDWIPENRTAPVLVAVTGTGWSATTNIVAASGGGGGTVGGARWNLGEWAAHRTRLELVVGATGGQVQVSAVSKGP